MSRCVCVGIVALGMIAADGAAQSSQAQRPPVAERVPVRSTIHGQTRVDDYAWLRQRGNSKVIAYLEAENAYAQAVMEHTAALQERLYSEMKGRIKENDSTVPAKDGEYYYYSRTLEGKQYRLRCRKKGGLDAPEEVLLNENKLAEGREYFRLGGFSVSPDHRLLAHATDTSGSEVYTLRVKNLETGELLADEIPNTYYGLAWGNDNRMLFYTVLDDAKRPYKLYRHTLGDDPGNDQLIHHEKDERFFVSVSRTRSDKYVMLTLGSMITNEVWFLDADEPGGEFRVVQPRVQGMQYSVSHHGDSFYIVTNDEAVNFKVVRAPVARPGRANWTDYIPHDPAVKIDSLEVFKDFLAVAERRDGFRTIRIRDLASGGDHHIKFAEPVYTARLGENHEFDTSALRYRYTSLVTPNSVFDYDVSKRTSKLMKQDEVLGGYDSSQYVCERIVATARDGTKVPISVVYKRGFKRDGTGPLLLYGYGSYGSSADPRFGSTRVSLLDRGVAYAIAHIRGGGEMGRPWYENGKLLHKRNTFTDFIDCAEHLVAKKYAAPDRLAIMGGSAGGLLMGAVTNMRPDLFKAVVTRVPFVDVINTMLDDSIPLTVIEYEEWGDPNKKQYYDYILSYSPYDNVAAQGYPNILITAGLNDPRVQYWEPAKWCAKLRALKTDDNRLLFKTNMGAGHGGASGRFDKLRETAFNYAFILDTLGVKDEGHAAREAANAVAGCAMCIFHMDGVDDCVLAVKIDGKAYLVDGSGIDDHGDAHATDGMCNSARDAIVEGEIRNGRFVAKRFELKR